jgi:hypothetical protein
MSVGVPRLRGEQGGLLLLACRVGLSCLLLSCGSPPVRDWSIGATDRPAVKVADWPPVVTSPVEAVTVNDALRSADGAQIQVRGYLIAITLPCPACNVGADRGELTKVEDRIGKTARPRGPDMPGCQPCPAAAATFSDAVPTASPSPDSAPLRAVGAAEGLQARHVGHMFLLTGTFRAKGAASSELDVSDVRAIDGQ